MNYPKTLVLIMNQSKLNKVMDRIIYLFKSLWMTYKWMLGINNSCHSCFINSNSSFIILYILVTHQCSTELTEDFTTLSIKETAKGWIFRDSLFHFDYLGIHNENIFFRICLNLLHENVCIFWTLFKNLSELDRNLCSKKIISSSLSIWFQNIVPSFSLLDKRLDKRFINIS